MMRTLGLVAQAMEQHQLSFPYVRSLYCEVRIHPVFKGNEFEFVTLVQLRVEYESV